MKLNDKIKIYKRNSIKDSRGHFLKIMNGDEFLNKGDEMEVYCVTAKPGQSRGGHFHKIANEWFTILKGQCDLILEDTDSNQNIVIKLSEKDYKTVHIPPFIAHEFINSSKNEDFLLLAYTDRKYRKSDTINYTFQ
tara:strand:- start:4570 stop:4977 length:408 start_codon:yes stop_codon:yes gene_type:complete